MLDLLPLSIPTLAIAGGVLLLLWSQSGRFFGLLAKLRPAPKTEADLTPHELFERLYALRTWCESGRAGRGREGAGLQRAAGHRPHGRRRGGCGRRVAVMKTSTFFAVVLIVWGVLMHPGPQKPSPAPKPNRPSDALVADVGPVVAIMKSHPEDGRNLAAFYSAVADVIARDQGKVVQTTAQLRELNRRAGLLMFQKTGIEGKYPGLAEAIDKVLANSVGLDNVALDAAKQTAAIESLRALAWACQGGQ